jgi:hypothetical protein
MLQSERYGLTWPKGDPVNAQNLSTRNYALSKFIMFMTGETICRAAQRDVVYGFQADKMTKVDLINRYTGLPQVTVEITCNGDANRATQLGHAVKLALRAGADLSRTNLSGANLSGLDLSGADLSYADLSAADLSDAILSHANLTEANLCKANLQCANLAGALFMETDLSWADLFKANLSGANLSDANLSNADLYCADLTQANLTDADITMARLNRADLSQANLTDATLTEARIIETNFSDATLDGARLSGVSGINEWIKCIQIEAWPITYTSDILEIGCERHAIAEWAAFDNKQIAAMDGSKALKFWRKYKSWIFQTIELCPARPTR